MIYPVDSAIHLSNNWGQIKIEPDRQAVKLQCSHFYFFTRVNVLVLVIRVCIDCTDSIFSIKGGIEVCYRKKESFYIRAFVSVYEHCGN